MKDGQPVRIKCDKCGNYYTQMVTNPSSGCLICKTKGIVEKMNNRYNDNSEQCPACNGTKVQRDKDGIKRICPACQGTGVIHRDYNGDIIKIRY